MHRAYVADRYGVPPEFKFLQALPRHTATCIISCADPRLIPEHYFSFGKGEMPVIRNAGGRAKDALRSLLVLENALGLGGVVIVHHMGRPPSPMAPRKKGRERNGLFVDCDAHAQTVV